MPNSWDQLADIYNAALVASEDEVSFGVGIPGNQTLRLVPRSNGGSALDLGCGSGSNLAALYRLGYRPTGVERSFRQLALAQATLRRLKCEARLVAANACLVQNSLNFECDLILSVGVGHFCNNLDEFIRGAALRLRRGGHLILSVPHPIDMITRLENREGNQANVVVGSYFPEHRKVEGARYWTRFAGSMSLEPPGEEYLIRPSDLVEAVLRNGMEIVSLLEPEVDDELAPCKFRSKDVVYETLVYGRIPQYLIVKARRVK